MRTTITLNDELVERASELTGITNRNDVIRGALETLIRVESARRLAALGGSDPQAQAPHRRSQP
ncbi:MAG: type II toxin-antitoxin system VapB family antitoxin [Propionibacteriaceae bacterium]|nr:type II toxin-antitoxin system VapB family antitoxin [Propionibacteriaceae bacterium]